MTIPKSIREKILNRLFAPALRTNQGCFIN
jgi:hypothetical protein